MGYKLLIQGLQMGYRMNFINFKYLIIKTLNISVKMRVKMLLNPLPV